MKLHTEEIRKLKEERAETEAKIEQLMLSQSYEAEQKQLEGEAVQLRQEIEVQ